jgi:hypothetical protein
MVMGMQVVERSRMPDFRAVLRRGIAVGSSQCASGDGSKDTHHGHLFLCRRDGADVAW